MKKKLLLLYLLICIVIFVQAKTSNTPEGDLVLWYKQPATNWMTSALPIGNGRIGAMIYGGIEKEQIQFNDKTLWTGNTHERGAYQNFGDIHIKFKNQAKASHYTRYLDINNAIAGVKYQSEGVIYTREYFASFPDDLIVMHLTANKKKKNKF